MKLLLSLAAAALCTGALGQDFLENQHAYSLFAGDSIVVLGSHTHREGIGLSYSVGKHEPRFENRFLKAQIIYEGYYDRTQTFKGSAEVSDALGILFYGRWYARWPKRSIRPFLDFGWGFQYADAPTFDLPSEINSTPVGALGVAIPLPKGEELALSMRYLHISNAGLVTPNRGQNEIFLVTSITF